MPHPPPPPADSRRLMLTLSVMLATIMQAIDTTIANVALPHMQGSMAATQDQIAWVLTSYIVAAAIAMPLTGFLSARLGRKRLFIAAVVGFTLASILCGAAQSLNQMVLFRLLQGVFGASLVPLSQAVLLDSYPRQQHGRAMALWGMGVMVGPILGPSLGGWLTEYYNWRWVFYINLPIGLLTWFGLTTYLHESPTQQRRFDLLGFSLLSIAIGALQMMLDRGQSLDWFTSGEVVMEGVLALLGLYLFLVHMATHPRPFLEPALFRDRNFSVGLLLIFVVGVILLATMALLPPFMQQLMGYPVIDVGLLLAPRGIGTMLAMLTVGRLAGRIDPRYQILFGLLLTTLSLWQMSGFTDQTPGLTIIHTGILQGLGLGFLFVPLSTVSFATLPPQLRNEGTALYSLMRNLGSSIGISWVITGLAHNIQANHAAFAGYLTPLRFAMRQAVEQGIYNIHSTAGLVTLNSVVERQASLLAYLQEFRFMMWITLAAIPLLLLLRAPTAHRPSEEVAAAPE